MLWKSEHLAVLRERSDQAIPVTVPPVYLLIIVSASESTSDRQVRKQAESHPVSYTVR